MNKKLYNILDLLRLNKLGRHTGYMLVFLPCAMGVGLYGDLLHHYTKVALFLLGAVMMRGAGCIINDIFDRDIDRHVERTKNRPIADGRIRIPEALVIFCILSLVGLWVLVQFSWNAIMVGFVGMFLLLTYPLAKRITFWPQAYLGLAFNVGVFIAVMDAKNEITWPSIVLYVGCIFWTLYYDTLYAFSDIKDDKKIGVKSLARVLEQKNYKLWLGCFGLLANVIISYAFFLTGHNVMIGFICASAFIFWQMITLDIYDSKGCLWKFTMNSYLGIIWAATSLIH